MCVHYVICSQAGNIPAKFLDHLLGVSRDFTRELNGIDSTNYQRVGLHWITAWERWTNTHTDVQQQIIWDKRTDIEWK